MRFDNMQDMKLIEALNDLRDEVRKQGAELRRDVIKAHLGIIRWLCTAVVLLGLALGGKDLLEVVLEAVP
jgi:hypothetical protein